jgi:hypothetical protein
VRIRCYLLEKWCLKSAPSALSCPTEQVYGIQQFG